MSWTGSGIEFPCHDVLMRPQMGKLCRLNVPRSFWFYFIRTALCLCMQEKVNERINMHASKHLFACIHIYIHTHDSHMCIIRLTYSVYIYMCVCVYLFTYLCMDLVIYLFFYLRIYSFIYWYVLIIIYLFIYCCFYVL